ncbi:MAG TPA: SusC/RagA family TonB-linked outer membrane protein [Flavitalea sp.]|nr:SusC/RagA family TonB-linked outer membrane protein [Flavitalea sp.]
MKLTAIILLAACLQVSAGGYAQQITLDAKKSPLEKIFGEIRKQTGFYFFYDLKDMKAAKPVSIRVKDAGLEETLNLCLDDQPFTYTIVNKTVVIKPKPVGPSAARETKEELQLFEIRGRVMNENGEPLAGATVHIASINRSAVTDANGYFTIEAPTGEVTITISYIGYVSQVIAVGNRSYIDVGMALDASAAGEEVVVTALGKTSEKRALGYSVQQIGGDKATISKSVDPSASLVGKIAGIQITGAPSSTFDNATVIIRGINGLAPGNPLFVLDGTPTDQANIIMDNVESMSVLKGAAATALYGNRASHGVVLVTSKKGSRKSEPVVELNLGASIENVYLTPPYQNEYAGGNAGTVASPGTTYDEEGFVRFKYNPAIHPASWASFDGQRMIEYNSGNAWGPKINGQEYRPYYSWFPGEDFGKLEKLTAYPDNARDFFRTGRNLNNSISVSGGGDKFIYRITYANQNRTLTYPNSDRNQNQVGVNASYDVSKRLSITTDMAYITNKTKGDPFKRTDLNVVHQVSNYFQRQIDVSRLKNYRGVDGGLVHWNIGNPNASGDPDVFLYPAGHWDNPYFIVQESFSTEKTNRLVGNLGLNYQFSRTFNLTAYARLNQNSGSRDQRVAIGTYTTPRYELNHNLTSETNYEVNLNYKEKFNDISVEAMVGGNTRNNRLDLMFYTTQGGLKFPDYYDISASVLPPSGSRTIDAKTVRSVYGKATFGYKNFLYLDGTLRNDWSSALPPQNNSYLYPSVSSSFVFTELMEQSNFLSFGKVRASYAQVGSDLGFNQVNIGMINRANYGSVPSAELGDDYRSGNIKPTLTKSWEIGAEFRFFNKIDLDIAYYQDDNINQILSVPVAPASGFRTAQINAGNIQRKGLEISVSTVAVKGKNFSWFTLANFSTSTSMVKELAPGIDQHVYFNSAPGIFIVNQVGKEWGTITGREFTLDDKGRFIFRNDQGQREFTPGHDLGSVLPDFIGGWFNSFNYKNFDLSFSIDFQVGGLIQSQTKAQFYRNGQAKGTTGVNDKGVNIREFPSNGGGIRIDGVWQGRDTTMYIPAHRYFNDKINDSRYQTLDATYVKMREIRLGYTIPASFLKNLHIKSANLGFMVNNAWMIYSPMRDDIGIDPSESGQGQGNGLIGYHGAQLFSTRTMGLNLRLAF